MESINKTLLVYHAIKKNARIVCFLLQFAWIVQMKNYGISIHVKVNVQKEHLIPKTGKENAWIALKNAMLAIMITNA